MSPKSCTSDFWDVVANEVFNQLPKWQAMSGNVLNAGRASCFGGLQIRRAAHSQDWTSLVAHIPGIKVCFPVTALRCQGLMNAALQGTDPGSSLKASASTISASNSTKEAFQPDITKLPIGEPDVKKEGKDITFLTIGHTLYPALQRQRIGVGPWV